MGVPSHTDVSGQPSTLQILLLKDNIIILGFKQAKISLNYN